MPHLPRHLLFLFLCLLAFACSPEKDDGTIDLSGAWTLTIDDLDVDQSVTLPATLDELGVGSVDTLGEGLNNYVLSGLRRNCEYIGEATYERQVTIPDDWAGTAIELQLERVLWTSTVFIDGRRIDTRNSLAAPHRYDLSDTLTPGEHTLTVVVDNGNKFPYVNVLGDRYPDPTYKEMAHAYTNHTQIKWNGLLGDLQLTSRRPTAPEALEVYPLLAENALRVTFEGEASAGTYDYAISGSDGSAVSSGTITATATKNGKLTFTVDRPAGMKTWDEFAPHLYTITVSNQEGAAKTRFGFREITGENGVLTLNGKRIFLRGNLECAIFPLTGHPPLEKSGWAELIGQAKAYGLNHLRFHSWCPPEAAFEAADEAGFYLQVELPHWSLKVGEDAPTTAFLRAEGARILAEYGNHPSFLLMALGNELQGDFQLMNEMVAELKARDDRHLYATTAFSFEEPAGTRPEPQDEYFITQWTKKGWIRGQGVFNQYAPNFNKDYRANSDFIDIPLISHEIGQYSVYPNLEEIDKYTGVLRPLNFQSIRSDLREKGMLEDAPAYTRATGKLAAMLYKEEIERAMKTPNFSGFQLLQLQDFPGQGTALVGLLDAFWQSKGVISAKEFREFNSEVVPLLRFEKAVYEAGEKFSGSIEIANFFRPFGELEVAWSVRSTNSGEVLQQGSETFDGLPVGVAGGLGEIDFTVDAPVADRLEIEVSLPGTAYRNRWNIWVYPTEAVTRPEGIVHTTSPTEAIEALRRGGTVLLNPSVESLPGVTGRFVPVFWSPVHFPDQPATMGLLIDPEHPALAEFPTERHTQWQWWDLCIRSKSLDISGYEVEPIVKVIDNFVTNRRLSNLLEVNVGSGKLLLSAVDVTTDLADRPVARQLRKSLHGYLESRNFNPTSSITEAQLLELTGSQAR